MQSAGGLFIEALHIQQQSFFGAADLTGLVKKGGTGFGQQQLAFAARCFDERCTVILLQRFYLGAEGGLGQRQLLGGRGQIACFGNGDEIAVKFKVHKPLLKYKNFLLY